MPSRRSYSRLLTASSTGWVLEYFPHSQLLYGGYPVTMTFGAKNEVLMASDAPVKGHSTDEVKSNYHLKSDKMVSLSFDTYNSALHLFSDPDKSYGAGEGEELRRGTMSSPSSARSLPIRSI